jgi:hydrogenase-4 component E
MTVWIDALMIGLILADLALLGSSRLRLWVRVVAAQGLALGALPILVSSGHLSWHVLLLGGASIGLRGIMFPLLLGRVLRDNPASREVKPYVGYTASLLFGVVAVAASLWIDARLHATTQPFSTMAGPVAIFTILVGLFLIISRRKAISQILGYLVMENGIYILGITLVMEVPVLVELGVLLDAFVAVFVMAVATHHLRQEFDHMDVDQLDSLKG